MAVQRVWIEDGCTGCGLCESVCPEVFEVQTLASVKEDVSVVDYNDCIIEAAEGCPVEVIKYE